MDLGRKTNFFLGKTKKTIFLEFGRIVSQKMVFFGFFGFSQEKVGFSAQNHLFPRKKLVFLSKTIFFVGKTKKTIFLKFGRIVSQKMVFLVFLVFPRQSWFWIGRVQCCR